MYDIETLSIVVLILMVATLLFQRWIFLFFKRVYKRSKNRYHLLTGTPILVIAFLDLLNSFYYQNDQFSYLAFFLLLFAFIFFLKITIFTENDDFGKSACVTILGGVLFIVWLFMGIWYFLNEEPLIIDIFIMTVVFIYWLDLMIRASRNTKRLWNALGTAERKK